MATKSLHILVVDDNDGICETLRGMLVELGYRVSTATNARDARAVIEADHVNLLVSDELMYGEQGTQLAEFAGEQGVPSLMMSGHPEAIEMIKEGRHAFISKPFGIDEFQEKLLEILTATESRR